MKNKNIPITICITVVISAFIFHFGIEYYKKTSHSRSRQLFGT